MKHLIKIAIMLLLLTSVPAFLFTGCSGDKSEVSGQLYYCPMHPEVQSDKPGVCPICHMDLVLKDHDGDDMAEHSEDLISLNARKTALAGVSTTEVMQQELSREITAYSYLDFAEQNRKVITARFGGRIEKLFVDRTGEDVKKGQPLFEIYSPELIQAQNDYLLAARSVKKNSFGDQLDTRSILDAARQKLLYFGLTENQIEKLDQNEKVQSSLTYYSPFSGTVIEKNVQEGIYVNEGTTIYNIADLTMLWSISEILSDDAGIIKEGSPVTLRLQGYPGEEFKGKVDLVYPVVNRENRSIKVRSVFQNRQNMLKPNMYGETVFSFDLGKGLVVPQEAVIRTGKRDIVWVQKEKGKFEPREIITGYKVNGNYQVLSGLKEGELVASEGSYLIDSESQLKTGGGSAHQNHDEINSDNEKDHSSNFQHSENEVSEQTVIFNKVCPVLGSEVPEDAVTVDYKGKKIGFCCPGCDQEFLADPDKYMKNLSADGKKFINKS